MERPQRLNITLTDAIHVALNEIVAMDPAITNRTQAARVAIVAMRDRLQMLRDHGATGQHAKFYADGLAVAQRSMR